MANPNEELNHRIYKLEMKLAEQAREAEISKAVLEEKRENRTRAQHEVEQTSTRVIEADHQLNVTRRMLADLYVSAGLIQ